MVDLNRMYGRWLTRGAKLRPSERLSSSTVNGEDEARAPKRRKTK